MTLSEELSWRGMVAENTFDDISELDRGTRKFYWGVDPSAGSMTIGNLAALMMVKCFMRYGYSAVLLAGGATGQIGDPKESGERDVKSLEEVEANVRGIQEQFRRIAGKDFEVVDNNDWFADMRFMPFLRDIFKQFSMTQLLSRKFVQDRIGEGGSGISLAEFCYSTIQGYDFLHLYREKGIDLQLCGADQYGNCVSGVHLIQRLEGAKADVWSIPLVIDQASGRKFGKSEGNAIWLSAEKTSVFDFYQFWLGLEDEGVEYYIKIYTTLSREEIGEIMRRHAENLSERVAQKALAEGVTAIVHGPEKTASVVKITTVLYGGGGDIADLESSDIDMLAEFIPALASGVSVIDALVDAKAAQSKAEARNLIASGAISVNGEKISEDKVVEGVAIIKKGKNKFILVR